MVKAEELIKDVEMSEEVKAKLVGIINPLLTQHENDLAEANHKLKEAIDLRQTAKTELRELREKFADGNYDGKKEMEALIKQKETEVASLSEKTKTLESDLAKKNEELETIQTETKLELKSRFTDVEWEKIKDKSVSDIRLFAQMKPEVSSDQSRRIKTYGDKGSGKTPEEKIASGYKHG